MFNRCAQIILILLLTGCQFGLPVKNPEPFLNLHWISEQKSNRQDVLRRLGEPHIKLRDNKYWIYGKSRIIWENLPPPHRHEYFAVLIQFNGDKVTNYELVRNEYSRLCWSNRLCLDPNWMPIHSEHGPRKLDRRFSGVYTKTNEDKNAKNFQVSEDECSVYIYRTYNFFQLPYPPTVTLGAYKDEPVTRKGYLYIKVPKGHHTMTVSNKPVEFQCSGSELVFFDVSNHIKGKEGDVTVKRIVGEKGRKEVRERRLLVTW